MSSTRPSRVRRAARSWTRLSDEQLLGMRFCDLKLKIERSPVAKRVRRLYRELDKRQISFRPPKVRRGICARAGRRGPRTPDSSAPTDGLLSLKGR